MKVLLTGAGGQLGLSLQDRAPKDWQLTALTSDEFDITKADQIEQIFAEYSPDVVINAAAYTAVDHAEIDEQNARAVNATAVKNLAVKCAQTAAFLVHISTDYVFDGSSSLPYKESDPLSPLNIYGKTKAEGEQTIIRSGANFAIIRTSWVFSEYGNNFLKSMMQLGKDREELKIVSDQMGAPTYAGDIAEVIIKLVARKNKINHDFFHFCGNQITSWADYATFIFRIANEQGKMSSGVSVEGISTEEYDAAASRPKNSVLDCKKIKELCDISLSDWQGAVKKIINDHY